MNLMSGSFFGSWGVRNLFHEIRRRIAKFWLKLNPCVEIIGVTGSYGKTNTVRAINLVLSEKYKTLQTDLNLDTIYNLPITILKLRPWHQELVLEYGINKISEMEHFHLWLAKPKIGVLTGITPVHADKEHLGSLKNIIKEKGKLLSALPQNGWAILNYDDERARKMAKLTKAKIIFYGTNSKNCDFWAEKIKVDFSGTSFVLHFNNQKAEIKIGLIGKHFVLDCLPAVAIGLLKELTINQIIAGLKKLKPLEGRMSFGKGPLGTILLDDHLRANLASTLAGLETFSTLPCRGRKIAVLGEMGEMGRYAKAGHRQVGQKIARLKIDFLVSIGPLQKKTANEAIAEGMKKENVFWVRDVKEAGEILKKILKKGDFLYLKGSLLRHLERVLLILKGEKVKCSLTSCHFYKPCSFCPNLK